MIGPVFRQSRTTVCRVRRREHLTFCIGECREGMAPRRILLVHGKAEASFAHSKRFAQYDGAVPVGASRCEGATEPRGSVWSARSLLPLWLVPRQHALWNRQDCKGEKLFLFQVQCQWAGRSPISALKN